jgi:hypothetical protein
MKGTPLSEYDVLRTDENHRNPKPWTDKGLVIAAFQIPIRVVSKKTELTIQEL